jgi:hypothetical protein
MDFSGWLNESSLNDLYKSVVDAYPNTEFRQHATDTIRITQLSIIPFKGTKSLFFKGLAQNEGHEYNTIIMFKSVKYHEGVKPNTIKVIADDGKIYYLERLSEDNEVTVRCECQDFYWRGVYANHLDKSLYGRNKKKYESLGIKSPVNPTNAPMLCKHLMKLADALEDAGILLS